MGKKDEKRDYYNINVENVDIHEIREISREEDGSFNESLKSPRQRIVEEIVHKVAKSGNIHESLRDILFQRIKPALQDDSISIGELKDIYKKNIRKLIQDKKKEFYEILENTELEISGKTPREVSDIFLSLLNIQSQLCVQKTEGVIVVNVRLSDFFKLDEQADKSTSNLFWRRINLLFTPMEIQGMRKNLQKIDEDDPLKPFFTTIIDQAYDRVQYNELSGYVLLEMAGYFLKKLIEYGYGDTTTAQEFQNRLKRAKESFNKSIDDLEDIERVIKRHVQDKPILDQFPKLLRMLIQVKLGMLYKEITPHLIHEVKSKIGDYSRARNIVSHDFGRLPSFTHGIHLRQSVILNLQKDILKYTASMCEREFRQVKERYEEMLKEIEANSANVYPDTPEYKEMMRQRSILQQKIEEHRSRLNVIVNQQRLVDVRHDMLQKLVKDFNQDEEIDEKINESQNANKIDSSSALSSLETLPKSRSRMFMAKHRNR